VKPGGLIFMEMPNHLSWVEGHYMVITPPIFSKRLLKFILKYVYRRNSTFADHLNTEINPFWLRKRFQEIEILGGARAEILTLGEREFLHRLRGIFDFEARLTEARFGKWIRLLYRINVANWLGHLLVSTKGYFPIYLCVKKSLDANG
jgi:hypothetical protein